MNNKKYKYLEDALDESWFYPVNSYHNSCGGRYDTDFVTVERVEYDRIHLTMKFVQVMGHYWDDIYCKLILLRGGEVKFNFYIRNEIADDGDIPILEDVFEIENLLYGKELFDLPKNLDEYITCLSLLFGRFCLWEGRIFNEIFEKNQHLLRNELIDSILND